MFPDEQRERLKRCGRQADLDGSASVAQDLGVSELTQSAYSTAGFTTGASSPKREDRSSASEFSYSVRISRCLAIS